MFTGPLIAACACRKLKGMLRRMEWAYLLRLLLKLPSLYQVRRAEVRRAKVRSQSRRGFAVASLLPRRAIRLRYRTH